MSSRESKEWSILAIWKDGQNPIKGPSLCQEGAMPSKMFIIHYNGKHKVYDLKARSTQGHKGEADSLHLLQRNKENFHL